MYHHTSNMLPRYLVNLSFSKIDLICKRNDQEFIFWSSFMRCFIFIFVFYDL